MMNDQGISTRILAYCFIKFVTDSHAYQWYRTGTGRVAELIHFVFILLYQCKAVWPRILIAIYTFEGSPIRYLLLTFSV